MSLSLPGYEILGVLGKGGMGVVYKARQVGLNRIVALKMILHAEHATREERQRFKSEAEAVARLQHPHIVQVFEVGEHNGLPFFSLEFCGGGSLTDKLDGTPMPPHEAAPLVETLARAMHVAHQAGIIHRDLKPANVLLAEDGTPKITDFGLAKRLDVLGHTQTGAVMGTPSYMAPEQARGQSKKLGPAADTYALGAILYECLTGRPPFKAATVMDTLTQVVSEEPVPPRRLQLKTPRDLETVCLKCLEKLPARRYATAQELAEELASFRAGQPVKARPVGRPERLWKWARRRPAQAALMLMIFLTLVGLVVGGGLFAWQAEEGRWRAEAYARNEGELRKEADHKRAEADEQRKEVERQKTIVENQAGSLKQKTTDLTAALRRAEKAEEEVRQEANVLRQERDRTRGALARTSFLSANREWEVGNVVHARELLEDVPADLRHWEWGYLWRRIRGGYCTLYGHTSFVTSKRARPRRSANGSRRPSIAVNWWSTLPGMPGPGRNYWPPATS